MRERRAILVRGIVQGVGFRPFVHALAARLDLGGYVRNQAGEVRIEIEGDAPALEHFCEMLTGQPPPLALIDHVSSEALPPRGERLFRIEASADGAGGTIFVSPDVATCAACLGELLDPGDRRYLYPFLNCTHCGPRLTIVTGAPYDRARTTMAAFPLCAACRAEYDDSTNRRFHAQPTACAACGPSLRTLDAQGRPLDGGEALPLFAAALRAGRIGAVKGLGGYHLACDARNAQVVGELRRRKHRDEKPFALMVGDVSAAESLCEVSAGERELLLSPRRPIVLLRKRPDLDLAEGVAPGNPYLGVMLPYTPLHHLLLHALPAVPLVMTSGNQSDEPIAYEDADALRRLAGIADVFLTHNRPIHVRCDDSVTRLVDGVELPLRRSRGYAPQPLPLPFECPVPILAVGGQQKGTFALGRGRYAFLSHHLGDLDHYEAYRAFVRDIELYQQLFNVRPEVLAHDLHPDYASTQYAVDRTTREGLRLVGVQHHHAHLASCMAEHGLSGPTLGVSFDGTGFGTDGAIWGGEFLLGDYNGFRRAGHLRYVGLPGGDRAVREPWRMAVAHLRDAGVSPGSVPSLAEVPSSTLRLLEQMLERGLHAPPTSSAGRLFDAVAAIAGVRLRASYEGQAAVELEWLATDLPAEGCYPFEFEEVQQGQPPEKTLLVDTRRLIRAVAEDAARGVAAARIARRFHSTLAEMIAAVCGRLRQASGVDAVALSGGVFLNALLTREVQARLGADGLRAYRHRHVPPSDGGLSLGQLAVAAGRLTTRSAAAPAAPGCPGG
jgi:hydrogenase maturation protein HypF